MAIEIDEMVVRASTGRVGQASTEAPSDPPEGQGGTGGAGGGPDMDQVKKVLLAECREMILEILADREER